MNEKTFAILFGTFMAVMALLAVVLLVFSIERVIVIENNPVVKDQLQDEKDRILTEFLNAFPEGSVVENTTEDTMWLMTPEGIKPYEGNN